MHGIGLITRTRQFLLDVTKTVVKIPSCDLHAAEKLTASFLGDLKWNIERDSLTETSRTISSHNSITSPFKLFDVLEPQIAEWSLTQKKDAVEIELQFRLQRSFQWLIHGTFFALLCFIPIPIILYGRVGFLVSIVVIVQSTFFALHIYQSSKYTDFLYAFLEKMYMATRRKVVLTVEGEPPTTLFLLWPLAIALVVGAAQASMGDIVSMWNNQLLWLIVPLVPIFVLSWSFHKQRWQRNWARPVFGYHYEIPLFGIWMSLGFYTGAPIIMMVLTGGDIHAFPFAALGGIFPSTIGIMLELNKAEKAMIESRRRSIVERAWEALPSGLWKANVAATVLIVSFVATLNMSGLYLAFSVMGYILVGWHAPLSETMIIPICREFPLLAGIYAFPLLALLALVLTRQMVEIQQARAWCAEDSHYDRLSHIASSLGLGKVSLAVIPQNRTKGLLSRATYVPSIGSVVLITESTLTALSSKELETIFIHELFHLKKHSRGVRAILFASELALLGRSFLLLMVDSAQFEFDADKMSIEYLEAERKIDRSVYIGALEKLLIGNAMLKILSPSTSLLGFADTGFASPEPGTETYSRALTLADCVRLLKEAYFGDLLFSYVHPPLPVRIERIRALR